LFFVHTISVDDARRLALCRAGLLKPEWTGLPRRASGRGRRAHEAALAVIRRFGYLQLDTVSIAGARSHAIVLLSRLEGFDPALAEELLRPGAPLFEYWGHEACWIPLELYPALEFRRREFRRDPWWGDVIAKHPGVARKLRRRIREQGPMRSSEIEGPGSRGWWDLSVGKKVVRSLWSRGELAVSRRTNFQRTFDLATRVIPDELRRRPLPPGASLEVLLEKALDGHGWATTGTLAATWRLVNRRREISSALARLASRGAIEPCALAYPDGRQTPGWIRTGDRALAERLRRLRPRRDRGVLLSPFDPLLWDRARVQRLFDFDQKLEIFKPAAQRVYGYYCMPVLAGDRLVARFDLKAERSRGALRVLSCRFENGFENGTENGGQRAADSEDAEAARTALARYARALDLKVEG
jgi:uncharacterized protein YcaQ